MGFSVTHQEGQPVPALPCSSLWSAKSPLAPNAKLTDTGVQGPHTSALVGPQADQSARTLPIWLYSPPPDGFQIHVSLIPKLIFCLLPSPTRLWLLVWSNER